MANGIPGFQSDGLVVGPAWVGVDLGALAPPARAALIKYSGRFVRVHPDDVGQLAAHGLEPFTNEAGLQCLRELPLAPRELEPGEMLEEGTIPPGVTAVPSPAPTPEPEPEPPARPAPTPAGRGGRSSR